MLPVPLTALFVLFDEELVALYVCESMILDFRAEAFFAAGEECYKIVVYMYIKTNIWFCI